MAYIGSSPTKVVSRQSANIFTYTATANQTAFTGADANGNTLACTPSDIMVHMNGLRLEESDFTASTTTVTLGSGAAAGDEVTITAFVTFETADAYTKSASDARYVNTAGDNMSGNLTTTGSIGVGTTSPSSLIDIHVNSSTAYSATAEPREDAIIHNINGADGSGVNNHATLGFHVANGATSQGFLNYVRTSDNTGAFTVSQRTGSSSYAEHLKIDGSGRVTTPNQVSFKAHGGNSAYITTSPLQFPNIGGRGGHNIGNHYNTSNSTFTAPVAGRYLFHVHVGIVRITSTGGYLYPNLEVNSGSIMYTYNNQSFNNSSSWNQYANSHMTQIVNLAANDVVRVTVSLGSADYYNGPGELSFAGHLLG